MSMLVVRTELWPYGYAALRETLGIAGIANVSRSSGHRADYVAVLMDPSGEDLVVRQIRGHVRDAGFWPLVSSATRHPAEGTTVSGPDAGVVDLIRERLLMSALADPRRPAGSGSLDT